MNWLNKLERKFGNWAIPNLIVWLIGAYTIGFVLYQVNPSIIGLLMLSPYHILHGQVWRLITWVFMPTDTNLVYLLIMALFYYQLGTALERTWGTFRFNVYFFMGVIGHVLAALLIYIITGQVYILTTDYLNFSLFFAFAATFPEMQFYLFFVLPIKAKYLALFDGLYFVYGFLFGGMSQRIAIVMSLLNFIVYLFMSRGSRLNPKEIRRKQVFHSQMREAQKTAAKIGRHRCAVCGRTEEDDPNLVFRYCSKCEGDYEYCQDHLYTHKHVTKGGMDPRQANSNQEA